MSPTRNKSNCAMDNIVTGYPHQHTGKLGRQLTVISKQYDLDGKGHLDEIQQAMRNYDVTNRGNLSSEEVKQIMESQLHTKDKLRTYRKVIGALVGLACIFASSNFGTSWAAAVLSKDAVADSETNTIQSKASGEVVGFQDVGYTFELTDLNEDEFEERRQLVHETLMDDFGDEDHQHRVLSKKSRGEKIATTIAWDQSKIRQRDLRDIIRRCDRGNTVNIKRKWSSIYGENMYDYVTICGPGTILVKTCKKKRNRGNTKVKCVLDRVELRQVGTLGRDKSIHFQCKKGWW